MRKKSKSTDQIKVRIPKELHQGFIEKLGETTKSEWLFNIDIWNFCSNTACLHK